MYQGINLHLGTVSSSRVPSKEGRDAEEKIRKLLDNAKKQGTPEEYSTLVGYVSNGYQEIIARRTGNF